MRSPSLQMVAKRQNCEALRSVAKRQLAKNSDEIYQFVGQWTYELVFQPIILWPLALMSEIAISLGCIRKFMDAWYHPHMQPRMSAEKAHMSAACQNRLTATLETRKESPALSKIPCMDTLHFLLSSPKYSTLSPHRTLLFLSCGVRSCLSSADVS